MAYMLICSMMMFCHSIVCGFWLNVESLLCWRYVVRFLKRLCVILSIRSCLMVLLQVHVEGLCQCCISSEMCIVLCYLCAS